MPINNIFQYQEEVGKSKLLSTTAGVGSIITSKAGTYLMPLSSSLWDAFIRVRDVVNDYPGVNDAELQSRANVTLISDDRLTSFLRACRHLPNLKYLIEVPGLEDSNKQNYNAQRQQFIPAIHFPRWFYNKKGEFKPLNDWKTSWIHRFNDTYHFAPPRDADDIIGEVIDNNGRQISVCRELNQINLVLICKNGHISDIPWYEYFCAMVDGHRQDLESDRGFDLFNYHCIDCERGGRHELIFTENRTNSESWGTLRCRKCGKTVSLEGIMNIHPYCRGEMPWKSSDANAPCERDRCMDPDNPGRRSTMQVSLVTSHSIYYADTFRSLFIPCVLNNESLRTLNDEYYRAFERRPELTRAQFINQDNLEAIARDLWNIEITDEIRTAFLQADENQEVDEEEYRYKEYNLFDSNESLNTDKLDFRDIALPEQLTGSFTKIQQFENLSITVTQLGFHRVVPPVPRVVDGRIVVEHGQRITSSADDIALPAIRSFGEGIFFELNREAINRWKDDKSEILQRRYNLNDDNEGLGQDIRLEMRQYGIPEFYLLHTFSHIIIKELEFSCGYQAASLHERLYYSDRMLGVLIYTDDGGDGSMGGLVLQGRPQNVAHIIQSALNRAKECSSDPMCWYNEESLNKAACFSCCMVPETSCEKRNLGLDRRILIDDQFGFFSSHPEVFEPLNNV